MSADGDEAAERSLDDLAHGDLGTKRMLRESLQRLADQGHSAELREMAQSVLGGRISLRQAALSQAYGSALSERVEAFAHEYQSMSLEERGALVDMGRRHLDRLAQEEADEQSRRSSDPLGD
jgi:hypothetical protein